eukprot:CAMPEP_0201204628 /NCGR_PEP_ID=MMETSP0851-20130426/169255_1 /ASSEMBLY_ACC=CAM_ASM_000631 /TAXON_ID=183588 /ORGANISM="Pseudo-nitzschia fraudulenta, Strain WWA7" /LENGTH=372 /DNA_ID=CAMNT_0047492757 /DNA_START=91 /DNA_END=1209 /DNA_ORIENTATION=-
MTSHLLPKYGDSATKDNYSSIESRSAEEEDSPSTPGFADGYSSFSESNKALKQGISHVVVYILIGVLAFSFVLETQWSILDSVYFSVVVFTTVGYGDLSPDTTTAGMLFTIIYALYGIIIVGIFLGILGDIALERQEIRKKESMKTHSDNYLSKITQRDPIDENATEVEMDENFMHEVCGMLETQSRSIVILIVLAMPVMVLEKWSFVKGIYWLIITGTTIGLGDETPENAWSKLLCIVYIPLAVAYAGSILGEIATSYVDQRNDAMEEKFLNRALNASDLKKMDVNDDGKVTKDEFLIYMLKTLGKVEQEDIDKVIQLFNKLDEDQSGSLTQEDIRFIPSHTASILSNKKMANRTEKTNAMATSLLSSFKF